MNRRNFLTGLASCAATVTAFVSLPSFVAKSQDGRLTKHIRGFHLFSKGGYVDNSFSDKSQVMVEVLAPQSWFEEDGKIVGHIAPKING